MVDRSASSPLSSRRPAPAPSSSRVSFFDVLLLAVMTTILLMYLQVNTSEVQLVRSTVDGRTYLVRRLPDRQRAADMLAELNADLITLVKHVMAKYGRNDGAVGFLYRNFDPENVSEGGVEHGYTSYSVNKGEKIVLCVRQRNKEREFVDKNVLKYVAIHELAHLMTHDVGHPRSFWTNFAFLLREAARIGLYVPVDYSRHPQEYCGIKITSSVI